MIAYVIHSSLADLVCLLSSHCLTLAQLDAARTRTPSFALPSPVSLLNHEHYQAGAKPQTTTQTMAPTRPRKQASAESGSSLEKRATSSGSDTPSTPKRSPIQKKPTGITLQQKQALIENLRLESTRLFPRQTDRSRIHANLSFSCPLPVTERARRLRAQYHLQAQGLRSRIEIRLNRIPTALRKATMGDLLLKYAEQAQRAPSRPLPQPVKDLPLLPSPQKPIHQTTRAPQVGRAQKRLR